MKKLFALILALAMVLCLAACNGNSDPTDSPSAGNESPSPENPGEVKMTDGRYFLDVSGMKCFIHFYEDGTYYALYFDGSVTEAGTWELVDKEFEYISDPGPDGDHNTPEDNVNATAPQVVVFTSYKTGTPVEVAYVDDQLVDMSLGGMANHRTLAHEPDYAYNPNVDEIPIQLYVFYANNDIGSNLILNHNKAFEDLTGDMYNDGTWELTGPGVYGLTYSDGTEATLTVANDGKSAVLAKADGTDLTVRDDYHEGGDTIAKVMSLRAEDVQVGLPMGVALRLDGYSDGTCKLIIEIAQIGAELEADTGTFEVSEAMRPTFHLTTLGDIEGEPDYAGASESGIPFTVHLTGTVSPEFNGAETPMELDTDVTGLYNPNAAPEESAPTVVASFRADDAQVGLPMGVGLRLDCYSDNTAVLIVEIAQIGEELEADKGTYEVSETMAFTFTFDNAGTVSGAPDYATATQTGIDVNVAYKADVEVEFSGTATPLAIDSPLTGTYSIA